MSTLQILALSYSFTGQTAAVMERICSVLTSKGHSVDVRSVSPVGSAVFPLKPLSFLARNAKLWMGQNLNPMLEPLTLNPDEYHCILLGFYTEHLEPCMPINAFLESAFANVLRGKRIILVQTCRNRWRRAFSIVKEKVENSGGLVRDALVISHPPKHLIPTLHYLFEGRDPIPGTLIHSLANRSYAFDETELEHATRFGIAIAHRLECNTYSHLSEWVVVNNQEGNDFDLDR